MIYRDRFFFALVILTNGKHTGVVFCVLFWAYEIAHSSTHLIVLSHAQFDQLCRYTYAILCRLYAARTTEEKKQYFTITER